MRANGPRRSAAQPCRAVERRGGSRAAGLAFALCGALLAAGACSSDAASPAPTFLRVPIGDAPVRGPPDAWVTLVEYADFQCPGCRYEASELLKAEAAYPDDLRVVFEHFPLDGHASALPAAIAAECAREQGRFWEMHDQLFSPSLTRLSEADLAACARSAGLDLDVWNACRSAGAAQDRVEANRARGIELGVAWTPFVVVNGVVVQDGVPAFDEPGSATEPLKARIEAALAAARASGIPRAEYYDRAVLGNGSR